MPGLQVKVGHSSKKLTYIYACAHCCCVAGLLGEFHLRSIYDFDGKTTEKQTAFKCPDCPDVTFGRPGLMLEHLLKLHRGTYEGHSAMVYNIVFLKASRTPDYVPTSYLMSDGRIFDKNDRLTQYGIGTSKRTQLQAQDQPASQPHVMHAASGVQILVRLPVEIQAKILSHLFELLLQCRPCELLDNTPYYILGYLPGDQSGIYYMGRCVRSLSDWERFRAELQEEDLKYRNISTLLWPPLLV